MPTFPAHNYGDAHTKRVVYEYNEDTGNMSPTHGKYVNQPTIAIRQELKPIQIANSNGPEEVKRSIDRLKNNKATSTDKIGDDLILHAKVRKVNSIIRTYVTNTETGTNAQGTGHPHSQIG